MTKEKMKCRQSMKIQLGSEKRARERVHGVGKAVKIKAVKTFQDLVHGGI